MSVSLKNTPVPQSDIAAFVVNFATHHKLTRKVIAGKVEYRGQNPIDAVNGSGHQFVLREDGSAYDHKLKHNYSLRDLREAENLPRLYKDGANPPHPPTSAKKRSDWDWSAPFTTFRYTDENGALLYEVLRQGTGQTKQVMQRRPNPNPEAAKKKPYLYTMKDTVKVLYGLPDVVRAQIVLVVEGEKATDAVNALLREANIFGDVVATTSPEGATKNIQCFPGRVQGKKVYIFPDNDEPGEKHALLVASAVAEVALETKIVDLPGSAPKGGADDWLNAEHVIGELLELAEAAPLFSPSTEVAEEATAKGFTLDDIGNGERFAHEHEATLRFCPSKDCWMVYENGTWHVDEHETADARAKLTARKAWEDACKEEDEEKRTKKLRHASSLIGRDKRSTMLRDAASEPTLVISPAKFDLDPTLFNCANGTLELETFKFREHSPQDYITFQSPVVFDPKATCPLWLRCLDRWMPDPAMRQYLQDSTGATLSGVVFDEFFNFLYGEGENGKSKFLGALEGLLGNYWHKTQAETLMMAKEARKSDAPSPMILSLKGARLVTSHEIDENHTFSSALIKDLTGRDSITARGIHAKRPETFLPQFTLWLYGNGRPTITDSSRGMWRRVRLIEFAQPIEAHERDPLLSEKLNAEVSGILNWALDGLRNVQKHGLRVPSAIVEATASYRREQTPVLAFVEERCELSPTYSENNNDLLAAWDTWCIEKGENVRNIKYLLGELRRMKCVDKKSNGARGMSGIRLNQTFSGNVPQVPQVPQVEESGALGALGAPISEKFELPKKGAKTKRGRQQDFEPYAVALNGSGGEAHE